MIGKEEMIEEAPSRWEGTETNKMCRARAKIKRVISHRKVVHRRTDLKDLYRGHHEI